jgi:hypothetical protein
MWKALLVLLLVGLFLGGSLMALKYTAGLGVPRARKRRADVPESRCDDELAGADPATDVQQPPRSREPPHRLTDAKND